LNQTCPGKGGLEVVWTWRGGHEPFSNLVILLLGNLNAKVQSQASVDSFHI
jgi:hypothetical protein